MIIICNFVLTFIRTMLDAQQNINALKDAALSCTTPSVHFWGVPDAFIQ